MKNIRSVFILLIGMISLTAFATTSKLDQKPKTELVSEVTFQTNDVFVVNDYQVTSFTDTAILKTFNELVTIKTVVSDVGWQKSEQKIISIHYQEKLPDNYFNKDFVYLTNKRAPSIRYDC